MAKNYNSKKYKSKYLVDDNQGSSHDYDAEDIDVSEIRINPEFYIHKGILKAQECLAESNLQEGMVKFRLLIENVVILSKASRMIDNEFDEELEQYKKTVEYKNEENDLIKHVKLANKKLELVMKNVFESKTITEPGKL